MNRAIMALGLIGVIATAASVQAQGRGGGRGPAAPAITSLSGDIQADWTRTRDLITGIVAAMPDDKFGFKPTPAQQTFAERVLHVATTDLFVLQALGGKTAPPTINQKAATKAELL